MGQAVASPIQTVAVIHNPKALWQSCGCFHIAVMTRLLTGNSKTNKAPLCGKEALKTQLDGRKL
jgi:hypothetical protein